MSSDAPPPSGGREVSDLIGVELTFAVLVWLIAVFACFFLVGVVVGMIVLLAGIVGFGWWAVAALRRADTSD